MSTTRSKPDFANPTTHGDAWIGIATTVAILAIASVLARLWARFVILRKPGADDYLIICALAAHASTYALDYNLVQKWYLNRHSIDVPIDAYPRAFKGIWIVHHLFYASALFTKLPILLYYLRVLARASSRLIKWILIGTIAFVVVYSICIFFGYGFNCNPVEASWLSYDLLWTQNHTFKCGNVAAISMFAAVMNCVTNYWMLGLTIFFVRGLNLAKKEKIVLGIFIGLGFIVCAAGTARARITHVLLSNHQADVFWKGYYICLLNDLESGLAIICACAPGLKAYTSLFNGSSKPSASYASGKGRPDASSGVSAPAKPGLAASPSSPGLRDDRSERLMVELGDLKFDFEQSSTTKEWSPV